MRPLGLLFVLAIAEGACTDEVGWSAVQRELPGALMSIWGTSASDVWAVGADSGDGEGPLVLHYDGEAWSRLDSGVEGDLWWVFGFADGPVFAGGEGGHILRYENGAFETMATPGGNVVFGIWGASADNLWAVGAAAGGSGGAFAWRYDGADWSALPLPADVPVNAALWKVYGRAADDAWLVGSKGVTLHFDGQELTSAPSGTERALFTVHGFGERFAAVGGFGTGVILEEEGAGWRDVTPPGALQTIGVVLTDEGGWAVGIDGVVYRRDSSGWVEEKTELSVYVALHSVWSDPDGGVWAVGGQVLAEPFTDGAVIYRGSADVHGGAI